MERLLTAVMAPFFLWLLTHGAGAQTPVVPVVIYVSSLTPAVTPINGHGPYERDKSNGEMAGGDGSPIRIRGTTYSTGLGVHATSDITFALNREYLSFQTVVGLDDELFTNGCAPEFPGSVVFQVFVDGTKAYDSGVLTAASPGKMVNIDVTGKTFLRLVVGDAGDGNICDHADWADAKLVINPNPPK